MIYFMRPSVKAAKVDNGRIRTCALSDSRIQIVLNTPEASALTCGQDGGVGRGLGWVGEGSKWGSVGEDRQRHPSYHSATLSDSPTPRGIDYS